MFVVSVLKKLVTNVTGEQRSHNSVGSRCINDEVVVSTLHENVINNYDDCNHCKRAGNNNGECLWSIGVVKCL